MRKVKISLVLILVVFLTVSASSRTVFGDETGNSLPNVTTIEVYDVDGLSPSGKETDGDLLDRGVNETFLVNQSDDFREYRFSFRIRNDGDTSWDLDSGDEMFHDGVDSSWGVNRVWYNISDQQYEGEVEESGRVVWDTGLGGSLGTQDYMWAKYLINISLESSSTHQQQFKVNDSTTPSPDSGSYDYHVLDTKKLGFLNLTLHKPPNDTVVVQNEAFRLNSSVRCEEGECGEVRLTPRYNGSSDADTVIPESSGDPFYTNASKSKVCSSDLLSGEQCSNYWYVNATGALESWHKLDANASSSFNKVSENDTDDSLVQINTALIIDLSWETVDFGVLDPGSENNTAPGNSDLSYNVTVDEDSEKVDGLWTRATGLNHTENSDYTIPPENMSYSDESKISTENFYSRSYQRIKSDIDPGSVISLFFWLDVPEGILKGEYNGTIYFKANSTR